MKEKTILILKNSHTGIGFTLIFNDKISGENDSIHFISKEEAENHVRYMNLEGSTIWVIKDETK